jgi:gamma-glutamyltranspeptidase/glutathione hydrolase
MEELRRRGHDTVAGGGWSAGYLCAVEHHPDGLLEAGYDPRGARSGVFPAMALAW